MGPVRKERDAVLSGSSKARRAKQEKSQKLSTSEPVNSIGEKGSRTFSEGRVQARDPIDKLGTTHCTVTTHYCSTVLVQKALGKSMGNAWEEKKKNRALGALLGTRHWATGQKGREKKMRA